MKQVKLILAGLLIGLISPILFLWLYLHFFFPLDLPFLEIIKKLFPGILMGKLLLLSIVPDLFIGFIFYKLEYFKLASGIVLGSIPYLIISIFMF